MTGEVVAADRGMADIMDSDSASSDAEREGLLKGPCFSRSAGRVSFVSFESLLTPPVHGVRLDLPNQLSAIFGHCDPLCGPYYSTLPYRLMCGGLCAASRSMPISSHSSRRRTVAATLLNWLGRVLVHYGVPPNCSANASKASRFES
jgi:hypothetical protein